MDDESLLENATSTFAVKGENKKKANKEKSNLTALEARRAVEELLDLKHYIGDFYEEVYEGN